MHSTHIIKTKHIIRSLTMSGWKQNSRQISDSPEYRSKSWSGHSLLWQDGCRMRTLDLHVKKWVGVAIKESLPKIMYLSEFLTIFPNWKSLLHYCNMHNLERMWSQSLWVCRIPDFDKSTSLIASYVTRDKLEEDCILGSSNKMMIPGAKLPRRKKYNNQIWSKFE